MLSSLRSSRRYQRPLHASSTAVIMNYPVTIFLLAAGICSLVPDAQGEGCGYAHCILREQQDSVLDEALVQFHFYNISGDFLAFCPEQQRIIDGCDSLRPSCPQRVTKPWDQRLTDDRYIMFLVGLSQWLCNFSGTDQLDGLSCTDTITKQKMQKCVSDPYKFTAACVFREFQFNAQCSKETQDFARNLTEALVVNPYNN